MNSQPEPNTDPRSGPLGSRAGAPRCRAGQWTSADLLAHYQVFATTVEAALAADDDVVSDRMRLTLIARAHARLTRAVR
jgi:hypothetical protein